MTVELSQFDLISLIISSIAVIISIFAFINARQYAIIEILIKMANAFFTIKGVIDTWKRVRPYIYKETIDKPETSKVGQGRNFMYAQ